MKITNQINTANETLFEFYGGNLCTREDVSFVEDIVLMSKLLFKEEILQNPILNLNVTLIYDCELEDPALALREDLGIKEFEEDTEYQMFEMLEQKSTCNEIAKKFEVSEESVRYNLLTKYDDPCSLNIMEIENNRIRVLDDYWIGNEKMLNEKIFSKLHKDINEFEFDIRAFTAKYMGNTLTDDDDNVVIRENFNNPRWEEHNSMLFLQQDDVPYLLNLKEAIGEEFKLILTEPSDEEQNNLDNLGINWRTDD
jgi:hypothetical protein